MGRYSSLNRQAQKPKTRGVHPVMQGIGCIMIFVIPIFSYAVAFVLVDYGRNRGWAIPPSWFQPIIFHPLLLRLQGLSSILGYISGIPHLKATLVFTLGLIVIFGGIMSVFYAFMYRVFGPPRYGPTDAPPTGKRAKAYKR